MKTTLDIPDSLFRQSKAAAALRGESLKDFVADSLRARLQQSDQNGSPASGWRRVFGKAQTHEVAEIDAIIAEEFSQIDPESWR